MKNDSITQRLTPNYNGVKDRVDMIREVIKLVPLIRDALPHQALGGEHGGSLLGRPAGATDPARGKG